MVPIVNRICAGLSEEDNKMLHSLSRREMYCFARLFMNHNHTAEEETNASELIQKAKMMVEISSRRHLTEEERKARREKWAEYRKKRMEERKKRMEERKK